MKGIASIIVGLVMSATCIKGRKDLERALAANRATAADARRALALARDVEAANDLLTERSYDD